MKKLISIIFIALGAILMLQVKTADKKNVAKAELFEIADVSLDIKETILNNYSIPLNKDIKDLKLLQQYYYAVDKKTAITPDLFDTKKFLSTNLKIDKSKEPSILVFHTHGSEKYSDNKTGVIEAGDKLCNIMYNNYGIKCLHITNKFDIVNETLQRDGAYERAEPFIRQIIEENPNIQLVIDLHRDGVNENLKLTSIINGKKYAKIMLFNGICRKWEDNKLVNLNNLQNPYLSTNLALSYQMQLKLNELYPGITRKIYINAYRYSLHMKDKSMLIELGAQTNSADEVYNSIEVLAEALNSVIS